MSTEVSEAAVEEVSGALTRNFASFPSQQWVDTAAALVRSGGNQAAAQLAPGETVEWLTPGIVHRNGKAWPEAVLLVTPHRLIVSATRGSIRTKREINSLYRGPESLMSVSHRLLPGSSADHWTLEIATQQGPFLFAIPNFTGSDALAQITGAFVVRRAQYTPETGILLDGAPWGVHVPAQRSAPVEEDNPFEAAKADLAPTPLAEEPLSAEPLIAETQTAEPQTAEPESDLFPWSDQPAARDTPTEPVEAPFWNPVAQAPATEPPETSFWSPPPTATEPVAEPAPSPFWSPEQTAATEDVSTPAPLYTPPTWDVEPDPEPAPEPEPELEATPEPEPVAPLPAADWYADPLDEANLRYWDGQAWTHHTAS